MYERYYFKHNKEEKFNFDLLLTISNLEKEELEIILRELSREKRIFINSVNKYEFVKENLFVGTLLRTAKNISYIETDKGKIYIKPEELHTALKYDTVVVEITHENQGAIKGLVERKNNKLVCEVKAFNNKLVLIPFNGNCEVHVVAEQELFKNLIVGDRVCVTLPDKTNDDNMVVANSIEYIGHFNDSFIDEISIAISKGFCINFSEEAMREAESLPKFVRECDKVGRVDLIGEATFTIDSIKTKDIDDAISIKKLDNGNVLLGVHIADVAYYIKSGTALFKEVRKRMTSVYIGDLVIPMIPSILSNGICALIPGVERLTRSTFIEYNAYGRVVDYHTCLSVIKSRKKMTYEDLNNYFVTNDIDLSYLPLLREINEMKNLALILGKNKTDNGYLEFESNDMQIKTEPYNNDEILGFENRIISLANKIIEFFMIECNVVRAKDFNIKSIPILYRVHDKPNELKLEDTFEVIKELGYGKQIVSIKNSYGPKAIQNILHHYQSSQLFSVISNLLLRSMAKARDSVDNIGHFALGEEFYCHFTAPIRRIIDLMLQILEDLFMGNGIGYNYID